MDIYYLQDYLEDDVIKKIYNNDFDFAEQTPNTKEYKNIVKKIHEQEKNLLYIEGFKHYLENRNIKESIEAEEQFTLGFKTAIKLIIESLH